MAKLKKYLLDDGTITNSVEVSEKTGLSIQASRTRLLSTSDPEKVWQHKQANNNSYKMRCIKGRSASIYNEMFCLALKTI